MLLNGASWIDPTGGYVSQAASAVLLVDDIVDPIGALSKKGTKKALTTLVYKPATGWIQLSLLPTRDHHLLTHFGKWGDKYKKILDKYGLGIHDSFNMLDMPHLGGHPKDYKKAILEMMEGIDKIAGGTIDKADDFKSLFKETITKWVQDNPDVIHKTTKSIFD